MARKSYDVIPMFEGYSPLPSTESRETKLTDCQNIICRKGQTFVRPGYEQVATTLSGTVMGLHSFNRLRHDEQNLVAFTQSGIVEYTSVSGETSWAAIPYTLSGSPGDFINTVQVVQSGTLDHELVFTNGYDPVLHYDGDDIGVVFTTESDPDGVSARYLAYYGNHLFMGYIYDQGQQYPQSVWVSDYADPFNFTYGEGSVTYTDLIDHTDYITGMKLLRGHLLIYRESNISVVSATGDSANPFGVTEAAIHQGTPAGRTVTDVDGMFHIFLGSDLNVYLTDGVNLDPVGNDVQKDILTNINRATMNRSHAVILRDYELYLLFIPTGSSAYPNKCYCYNYREKHWTFWNLAHKMTASCIHRFTVYDVPTWGSYADGVKLSPEFDGRRWNDPIPTGEETVILGDEDGNIYKIDLQALTDAGSPIEAFLETKDYQYDGVTAIRQMQSTFNTDACADNTEINVSCSVNGGLDFSTPVRVDVGSADRTTLTNVRFVLRGKGVRLKVSNVNSTRFVLNDVILKYTTSGKLTGREID